MRKMLLAAVAALLLYPAAASADQVTFGSDLSGTPDVADKSHLADYLTFNVSQKNSHQSPVSGEILAVRIKGRIVPRGGGKTDLNLFHTQTLNPNADGTFTVVTSSNHLYFPVGGSADQVHTFVPDRQCIRAGEYLDFNHIGGWDGDMADGRGTEYQIWKSDPTSVMYWYEQDAGTNNGTTFRPNRQVLPTGEYTANPQHGRPYNRELMMQVVVGTGFDASNGCEGGLRGYEYDGVAVREQRFTVRDDGVAGARLACVSGRGFCEGVVRLDVDGAEIGQASFKITRNLTTNVDVPLTPEGHRLVNLRGEVQANVVAESRDEVGQHRTTNGVTTLKSARPGGFPGATVRAQSASVKGNEFSFRATCPASTIGACTGTVSVASQKRVILRRGSRGKVYRLGKANFTIQPGQTARVPVKLNAGGRAVFKKVKSVVAIATVTTRDGAGVAVSKRSKLTLKRR